MPQIDLAPDASLFYRDDTYADPWTEPEAALLLHGAGENGRAWNGWMPSWGRRYRVIRPDMRGFGQSTPMPADYAWSFDTIVADFIRLMDTLGIERFHLAGAKIGGGIAVHLAATHPQRVRSLTLCGARIVGRTALGGRIPELLKEFQDHGFDRWLYESMPDRLGHSCPPEMLEGWVKLMGQTAPSTFAGFLANVQPVDLAADLPKITAPTLVLTPKSSGVKPVNETRAWQERIPHSEMHVLSTDSFHVAVTHSQACAEIALEFIDAHAGAKA